MSPSLIVVRPCAGGQPRLWEPRARRWLPVRRTPVPGMLRLPPRPLQGLHLQVCSPMSTSHVMLPHFQATRSAWSSCPCQGQFEYTASVQPTRDGSTADSSLDSPLRTLASEVHRPVGLVSRNTDRQHTTRTVRRGLASTRQKEEYDAMLSCPCRAAKGHPWNCWRGVQITDRSLAGASQEPTSASHVSSTFPARLFRDAQVPSSGTGGAYRFPSSVSIKNGKPPKRFPGGAPARVAPRGVSLAPWVQGIPPRSRAVPTAMSGSLGTWGTCTRPKTLGGLHEEGPKVPQAE